MSRLKPKAKARRRRRPGELWTLWRVQDCGRPVGFLVTDRARIPNLIAFVPGTLGKAFARALAIDRDHCKASGAIDLRGRNCGDPPEYLKRKIIYPVNALGRTIEKRGDYTCASFEEPFEIGGQQYSGFTIHLGRSILDILERRKIDHSTIPTFKMVDLDADGNFKPERI